jgi:hypothetical protein
MKGLSTPGLDAEEIASRVRASSTWACAAGRMVDPLSHPQGLVVTEPQAATAGGGRVWARRVAAGVSDNMDGLHFFGRPGVRGFGQAHRDVLVVRQLLTQESDRMACSRTRRRHAVHVRCARILPASAVLWA